MNTTPTSDLDAIVKPLREELPRLHREYGVTELAVFGSRVRGEANTNSDLDVLISFGDKAVSLIDFVRLERELSTLLGLQVDLVERAALKPILGRRILDEIIPVAV